MKKFFKVALPIILSLLILGSIAWYALIYDRDFTRDMLLQQARFQEKQGNHALSAWFYDQAYNQSNQSPDVAIELANQFKSIGNYTKAEYTLSNAIANYGSTELYTALCQIYVEQDKLLDAVSMLENVTDPEIKAELEAMRPAAPTVNYEPGFYSQYITVTPEAAEGTLYINTEGEYPSTRNATVSPSITLPAGETTIYALAVGDNGLVSKLSIFGYTIGGVVEKVTFSDPAIESAVRQMLQFGENHDIFTNDLWSVTEFTVPAEATAYDDLAHLPYLEKLTLQNAAADLTVLAKLIQLTELDLTGSTVTDDALAAIASLPNLQKLSLADCNLSTIANLEGASSLTMLNLESNTIRNINALASMKTLTELNMQHNALTSLTALEGLSQLTKLNVSYNALSTLAPLKTCAALQQIDASHNQLTTLEGVKQLSSLTLLNVSNNALTDVSILADSVALTELNISNNQLTDISALAPLINLAFFNFSYNEITALPQWSADSLMVSIDGSYNQVENLDVLGGLQRLNGVYFDYNKLTSVEVLADCPRLMRVNVYGNEIEDVSMLTDMSVVVNYTPIVDTEE